MESIEVGKQIFVDEVEKYNNSYYWYNVTVKEYLGRYLKKINNFYVFEDEHADAGRFDDLPTDSEPDIIMRIDDDVALEIIIAKEDVKVTKKAADDAYRKSEETDKIAFAAEKLVRKLENEIMDKYKNYS